MGDFQVLTVNRINQLRSEEKQIAFAYSACIRMFPNYRHFSKKVGWGDVKPFEESLKRIRDYILLAKAHDNEKLLEQLYSLIPDSEDFSDQTCSYAISSGSAIYYTLKNIGGVNPTELSWSLVLSRDTVDAYVQTVSPISVLEENYEQSIAGHPLMLRELNKQELDFKHLLSIDHLNTVELDDLIKFNADKSNIDLS